MKPRKPERAVLYARVSTDRGEQDPESQLVALRAFATERGLRVVGEEQDRVTSDPRRRRREPPGLNRALRLIDERQADVLVIFSADRLVADPVRLLQFVARVQDMGGAITSVQDGQDLDTTTEVGELLTFMRGWFNRMRVRMIRKFSVAGQARARLEGRHPGRPRKLVTAEEIEAARAELEAAGKTAGARALAQHLTAQRVAAVLAQRAAEGKSASLPQKELRKLTVSHTTVLRVLKARNKNPPAGSQGNSEGSKEP